MNLLSLKTPGENGTPGQDLTPPSGIPSELQNGLSSSTRLIQLGINLLLFAGITIAVIIFMISGIQWITSGGDPTKISAAKRRLVYAIIGIVVMSSAFFIVRIVVTTLGGEPAKFLTPSGFLQP